MSLVGNIFITIGTLFLFLSGLGILRMPDIFNRLQAGTKATTLGLLSILIGVGFIHPGWFPKLIILALFVLFTNPVGSHYLAKISYLSGEPMVIKGIDSYKNRKRNK